MLLKWAAQELIVKRVKITSKTHRVVIEVSSCNNGGEINNYEHQRAVKYRPNGSFSDTRGDHN